MDTNKTCSLLQYTQKLILSLPGPILIFGASGFIGSNLLQQISTFRSDVFGTVFSGSSWRLQNIPSINILFCDIKNEKNMLSTLDKVQPKTIFDCSSFGAYSFEKDYTRIHSTNYISLIRLLEALKTRDITAYIHAGSSSEYGTNASAPKETDILEPNSHYAVSKCAAAHALYFFGKSQQLPVINLRLYSVYGPYEDSSRLIPQLCVQSTKGHLPCFANPKTSRDFIHINDIVSAFCLAVNKIDPNIYGESFNIGTGTQTTLEDLALLAKNVFQIKEEPIFSTSEARYWDVDTWYADPSKAQEILGWKAQVSLKEGLISTQKWWAETSKKTDYTLLTKKNTHHMIKNSISAVVACYKDAEAIPIMYERLVAVFTKLAIDYEIIFVNDCSPDNSSGVIQQISAKDSHVLGIVHSRNFGSQAAFRSGMEVSTKEAVVLLDGDLQDPPEIIEAFVEKWREGADVVYGKRVKRDMPLWLEFFYKSFYWLFSKVSEIPIPVNAGDFSLIDYKVVQWILACKERDFFLRGLRAYVGFKQVPIDYIRPERAFGKSTNNWIKNFGWAKKAIFSFTRIPLHLLTFFGGVCVCITILLAVWALLAKIFSPEATPKGITALVLIILFFGSSTVLGLGLLGEYIGKIFEEVKLRPAFIRKERIAYGKKEPFTNAS